MDLTTRLVRLAGTRPHALVVAARGGTACRLAVERELLRRGWPRATSPADADLLVLAGVPGAELAAAADAVWAAVPTPRARCRIDQPADVAGLLDRAAADLVTAGRGWGVPEGEQVEPAPSGNEHHEELPGVDGEHDPHDEHGQHGGPAEQGGRCEHEHSEHEHSEHEHSEHGSHDGHGSHAGHGSHSGRTEHSARDQHDKVDDDQHGSDGGHDAHAQHGSAGGHGSHSGHKQHESHGEHSSHGGHGGHGSHGGHAGHGGMEMPGGLPMADLGEDRDGLMLDQLQVSLGPVLPDWPAGLVLDLTLQGDVVQEAAARLVDDPVTAPFWTAGTPDEAARRAVARELDALARLLGVAGWEDPAARARRLRDDLLEASADVSTRATCSSAAQLSRRVRRSRTLCRMLRGLPDIPALVALRLGALDRALAAVLRRDAPGGDTHGGDGTGGTRLGPAELERALVGAELAAARLLVAAADPDTDAGIHTTSGAEVGAAHHGQAAPTGHPGIGTQGNTARG